MIKISFTQNLEPFFLGKTNEKHDSTMMTTLFKTFFSYL